MENSECLEKYGKNKYKSISVQQFIKRKIRSVSDLEKLPKTYKYLTILLEHPAFKDSSKSSLEGAYRWYLFRYPIYRIIYKFFGMAILVIFFHSGFKITTVEILADFWQVIALLLVSLASFFNFKVAWSEYYIAQFTLKAEYERYILEVDYLLTVVEKDEELCEKIHLITKIYLENSNKSIVHESKNYFSNTKLPSSRG